jgi:hypothetical protein
MLGACLPDEVEQVVAERVMPKISTLHEAKQLSGRPGGMKSSKTQLKGRGGSQQL